VVAEAAYYFSTTSSLLFERQEDINDGVPGSPDQLEFKITNIFAETDI